MRSTAALIALALVLGTAMPQSAKAQQDPFSAFLRALVADFDRATREGFRPYSDDDDDDRGRRGGWDDDDDDGGWDDDDDDGGWDDDDDDDGGRDDDDD